MPSGSRRVIQAAARFLRPRTISHSRHRQTAAARLLLGARGRRKAARGWVLRRRGCRSGCGRRPPLQMDHCDNAVSTEPLTCSVNVAVGPSASRMRRWKAVRRSGRWKLVRRRRRVEVTDNPCGARSSVSSRSTVRGAIRKGPHRPAMVSSRPSARSLHPSASSMSARARMRSRPVRRDAPPIAG